MSGTLRTVALLVAGIVVPAGLEARWLGAAAESAAVAPSAAEGVAVASASEDQYCTPALKQIVRRVAGACGLLEGGGRGCKPGDAKTVAALNGADFNALFKPLAHRARIVQFDPENVELDAGAEALVDSSWSDQRGASFFFVVARASPDGDSNKNQILSQKRAEAVLDHLQVKFKDPDLKREVGLLWLGEEYAQLSQEFCEWTRSREGECTPKEINRSAFIAWIDCPI